MRRALRSLVRRALLIAGLVWVSGPALTQGRPVGETTPVALVNHITRHPEEIPEIFRPFGDRLMRGDPQLERFLAAFTREHAKRERDVRVLVSLQLVDPNRFLNEPAFRARVLPLLPRALDESVSLAVRTACMRELQGAIRLSFDEAEPIAAAWGVIARRSSDRRVALSELRMPDDLSPIETSIFSITSEFFTAAEAKPFLAALRKMAPKRRIVVLTNLPLQDVTRVESFSRPYTPWPRDPFITARGKGGGIVFLNRPNLQPEREEDANMVRALVQAAPLDARWTVAPVPFHNGHVLLTPDAAWISIHTVELRTLELLGIDRVPIDTFGTRAGIERYLAGVRNAAKELEELYQRPVKFVHSLDPDPVSFRLLGGGGGFDLDSIVTMLPQRNGSLVALVGDISHDPRYTVPRAYGVPGKLLPAKELDAFVDTVAKSLQSRGIRVRRLPLMLVEADLRPFLITWNNVVLEPGRAEGFASLIDSADALAKKTFAAAGYELTLLPPLIESIVRSGGYRCASNHIRAQRGRASTTRR